MLESVPLKSKRVETSRLAWSTALRTSCMSTSETTSNVGMARSFARGVENGGCYCTQAPGRYPSGQREQSVKPLRKLRWFESSPAHSSDDPLPSRSARLLVARSSHRRSDRPYTASRRGPSARSTPGSNANPRRTATAMDAVLSGSTSIRTSSASSDALAQPSSTVPARRRVALAPRPGSDPVPEVRARRVEVIEIAATDERASGADRQRHLQPRTPPRGHTLDVRADRLGRHRRLDAEASLELVVLPDGGEVADVVGVPRPEAHHLVAEIQGVRERSPHRMRCISTTSSHCLNLRPTSRSTPTCSKPHRAWRAMLVSWPPTIRAITVWKP